MHLDASYIDGPACKLFVTRFKPNRHSISSHVVLCLPPFGEELNKARRMLALQGRALARNGIEFVLPDVRGTGDSEGRFGTTTWQSWCEDIGFIGQWLVQNGAGRVDILALRTGIYLAPVLLEYPKIDPSRVALWSPVATGKALLNQLFRSVLLRNLDSRDFRNADEVRQVIIQEGGMEVAGYWLSGELVKNIDALDLGAVRLGSKSKVFWADVSPVSSDQIPQKTVRAMKLLDVTSSRIKYRRFVGSQFWMGPEIETVPALIQETVEYFTTA